MKEEKMHKKPSFGNAVRKRLSDITNSQRGPKSPRKDDNPLPISTKDYIEQLHKENMMLMRLLADRNKIIELTGTELAKMRVNLQQVQQQNWQLAQANSHMLAELNLGKDKLKALHHELGCKAALLSAKDLELQEKMKKPCQKTRIDKEQCRDAKGEALPENGADNKKIIANQRHQSRSLSMDSSGVREQVPAKEKRDYKSLCLQKQSVHIKSELEHTEEKADNKRLCLRRQSARFKSKQQEPTEDLFEIEDVKFPVHSLHDDAIQGNDVTSSTAEEGKGTSSLSCDTPAPRRSSIGRPTRKVTEKVQSYKELPVNVKMRRSD